MTEVKEMVKKSMRGRPDRDPRMALEKFTLHGVSVSCRRCGSAEIVDVLVDTAGDRCRAFIGSQTLKDEDVGQTWEEGSNTRWGQFDGPLCPTCLEHLAGQGGIKKAEHLLETAKGDLHRASDGLIQMRNFLGLLEEQGDEVATERQKGLVEEREHQVEELTERVKTLFSIARPGGEG